MKRSVLILSLVIGIVMAFALQAVAQQSMTITDLDKKQRVVFGWDGWDSTMRIGNPENHYDSSPQRLLLQFDLSGIPQGQKITSAKLVLQSYNPTTTAGGIPTAVHQITEPWTLGVKWPSQPEFDETPAGTAQWNFDWSVPVQIDITNLVQGWYDGSYDNYGMTVRANTAGEPTGTEPWTAWWNVTTVQLDVVYVPEPGSLLALGGGLVGMAGFVIRRRKRL